MRFNAVQLAAMTTLTIKDVPEPLAEHLRQRAARNHRSLQGELMSIIEQAVLDDAAAAQDRTPGSLPRAGFVIGPGPGRGWKTMEQVYAELRTRHPEPIRDQADSIALIREDRDSR